MYPSVNFFSSHSEPGTSLILELGKGTFSSIKCRDLLNGDSDRRVDS